MEDKPEKKQAKYLRLAKNKYLLTLLFVAVWMTFFDRYNVFYQMDLKQEVDRMESDKDFYVSEISRIRDEKAKLFGSEAELQRFAREKYWMKKENEDLFILVDEKQGKAK